MKNLLIGTILATSFLVSLTGCDKTVEENWKLTKAYDDGHGVKTESSVLSSHETFNECFSQLEIEAQKATEGDAIPAILHATDSELRIHESKRNRDEVLVLSCMKNS